MTLEQIRIVLVEPAGALNVGSVARIMKNMGLSQLVLVNPRCDRDSREAKLMAVRGHDILTNAKIVKSLPEALQGSQRAIATTGVSRNLPIALEPPDRVLPWLLEDNPSAALIFGREDRGLSNEEMNYAQRFLGIPARSEYSSLNLAQAVTVCTYELYKASQNSVSVQPASPVSLASLEELEGYYQNLEEILLKIGYLYPHTAKARMEKFRMLYNRAMLGSEEVALLRGILRQVNYQLSKSDKK
ncbi:MAG: RNA methyltransferase [Cyanobacteria bacterium SBLK]|nr:RNA methyltransferase [Cyanobacteria bacterium SBLK]